MLKLQGEGSIMVIANLLIVLPTLLYVPMRTDNNHVIFATHAFFDMINGAGYVTFGWRKIQLYYPFVRVHLDNPKHVFRVDIVEPTTPVNCLWHFSTLVWLFSEQVIFVSNVIC